MKKNEMDELPIFVREFLEHTDKNDSELEKQDEILTLINQKQNLNVAALWCIKWSDAKQQKKNNQISMEKNKNIGKHFSGVKKF